MMFGKFKYAIFSALVVGNCLASEVEIPNEFASGTPALASEVNANFTAIETAVNDNDSRIQSLETSVTSIQNELVQNKHIYLQEGLAGYAGTEDTTLTKTDDVWTSLAISGQQGSAEILAGAFDNDTFESVAVPLLRFDLTGLSDDMLAATEACETNIDVMEATLLLRGRVTPRDSLVVRVMNPDSQRWSELEANWTESSQGIAWPVNLFPEIPILDSVEPNYLEPYISDGGSLRAIVFHIDTLYIKQWLCDSNTNNGFLIGYGSVGSGPIPITSATVMSSEFSRISLRPKLKLVLQRVE